LKMKEQCPRRTRTLKVIGTDWHVYQVCVFQRLCQRKSSTKGKEGEESLRTNEMSYDKCHNSY